MAYAGMAAKAVGDTFDKTDYDIFKANHEAAGVAVVTTKGDIPAATGAQAIARLGVGAAGTRLVPDAGEPTGLRWQIQPTCRVRNNAPIDPAVGAWVTLTFNTELWDTNGMHSTLANTSRLTVPANGDGIYAIAGNALFDTSAVGGDTRYYGIRVRIGGATTLTQFGPAEFTMNTYDMALHISAQYSLVATNYVELQIFTTWDLDILSAGTYSPAFGATFLRVAP